MSWNDPNFWAALLGGGIISAIMSSLVSLLIAFRFGPRHVEKERIKREHSTTLMVKGLIPWRDGHRLSCPVGFQYSPKTDRIEGRTPEDPKNPVPFDALKAHLASGYHGILGAWEDYKRAVLQHNRKVAEFLEEIRIQIADSAALPQYYPRSNQKTPDEYIIPVKAAEEIYRWLNYESVNREQWNERPRIEPQQGGDGLKWYELKTGRELLAKARDKKKFNSTLSAIDTIRNSTQNRQMVDQFVKTEREELQRKEKQFEDEVNNIIRSIELGNCLKGKCEDCPK